MPVPQAAEPAEALSRSLLDSLLQTGEAPRESLEQLCSLAIAEDPAAARGASAALFRNIIEPLGDSFDPAMDDLYVRFFSGVIDYCRRQKPFGAFDGQLREFGLSTNQQLIERAARIRRPPWTLQISSEVAKRLRTVLVPSRVTLGADIAVTSVILSRLKAILPEARIVLLGSAKAGSLFASDPRIELLETNYPRGGSLRERLDAWAALCQSVSKRLDGLLPDEYMIVDPDSRLTQLGLLPLEADDSRYYYFDSRSYAVSEDQPLAVQTGCWLMDAFGEWAGATPLEVRKPSAHEPHPDCSPEYPYVALPAEDIARGEALKANAPGPLAAVNLGVGENADKRVEDPYEEGLLLAFIAAGYTLVLDRGAGDEEMERTARWIGLLQSQGKTVAEVTPTGRGVPSADVYVWQGSLSGFGGLIAAASLYCGYDSAGGHLAAAMGVPVIATFSGDAPTRFRARWTPWGEGPVRVVTARRSAPREALRDFQAALREQPR